MSLVHVNKRKGSYFEIAIAFKWVGFNELSLLWRISPLLKTISEKEFFSNLYHHNLKCRYFNQRIKMIISHDYLSHPVNRNKSILQRENNMKSMNCHVYRKRFFDIGRRTQHYLILPTPLSSNAVSKINIFFSFCIWIINPICYHITMSQNLRVLRILRLLRLP